MKRNLIITIAAILFLLAIACGTTGPTQPPPPTPDLQHNVYPTALRTIQHMRETVEAGGK